ncbi:MAG: hypothetical protein OES09_14030, partial [Gammaproteobacteria bacterium]|nr:hypothetical protein [Gammaproteobacteria bacterium]
SALCAVLSGPAEAEADPSPIRPPVETEGYLAKDYPFIPVALHGLSLDWPLDRILATAVRTNRHQSRDYFNDAARIVRAFRGWRCTAGGADDAYRKAFQIGDLETPDLDEIIKRYFDGDERLLPYPNWFQGAPHLQVPISELRGYVNPDHRWYRTGDLDEGGYGIVKPRPVIVSLYKEKQRVLVDIDVAGLESVAQAGARDLPVVVWYNTEPVKFVSGYGTDATIKTVVDAFFEDGYSLTLVPQLGFGDHHLVTTIAELKDELDYVPALEDIDEERVEVLAAEFRNIEFRRPLPVALFRVEGGRAVRAVESDRLAVAENLGITQVPVAFYFINNAREWRGARRVDCDVVLCEAAGGNPLDCGRLPQFVEFGAQSPGQPGGVVPSEAPPVSPPPVPPPITPPPFPPQPPQVIIPPPPASP